MGGRSPLSLFLVGIGGLAAIAGGVTIFGALTRPRSLTNPDPQGELLIGLAFAGVGLIMCLVGFLWDGLQEKMHQSGTPVVDTQAKVQARYAYREGRVVVSDWEYDEPGTTFFVRLTRSNGLSGEYQCARETFEACGEGLTGEATIRGRWLGSFRAYIGAV